MKRLFLYMLLVVTGAMVACEKPLIGDEDIPQEEKKAEWNDSWDDAEEPNAPGNDSTDVGGYEEDTTYYDRETPYEETNIVDGNNPGGANGGIQSGDTVGVMTFITAETISGGVYVHGYIVGACTRSKNNAQLEPPFTNGSALLMADSKTEKNIDRMISIELKSGSAIREALDLTMHPERYQQRLMVFGYRTTYLGMVGIKDISAHNFWLFE